ncbi:unnamed protein product [Paramecium sonneborni]|uniref:Uncharacterized protein n=1 Tax=Paramecium sonneborni TaxID=65129 RepID=A0A8S1QXB5_9CILI|nr:unnamed protein product [Paramecium sonneborni]
MKLILNFLIYHQIVSFNFGSNTMICIKNSFKNELRYQLKIQSDLIKALLASSRKIFKDNIDDLAYQVKKDLSSEKQMIIKKLVQELMAEHSRRRPSTQDSKKKMELLQL